MTILGLELKLLDGKLSPLSSIPVVLERGFSLGNICQGQEDGFWLSEIGGEDATGIW